MKRYKKTLVCTSSALLLAGALSGCVAPGSEAIGGVSQLELLEVSKNSRACRNKAILSEVQGRSLASASQETSAVQLRNSATGASFSFAEAAADDGDEGPGGTGGGSGGNGDPEGGGGHHAENVGTDECGF